MKDLALYFTTPLTLGTITSISADAAYASMIAPEAILGTIIFVSADYLTNANYIIATMFDECETGLEMNAMTIGSISVTMDYNPSDPTDSLNLDAPYVAFNGLGFSMETQGTVNFLWAQYLKQIGLGLDQSRINYYNGMAESWFDDAAMLSNTSEDIIELAGFIANGNSWASSGSITFDTITQDVSEPSSSVTSLKIVAQCPIVLNITLSNGQYITYNTIENRTISTIPYAVYSGPQTEPQVLVILNFDANTTYTVTILGTDDDEYSIELYLVCDNATLAAGDFTGTAVTGQSTAYRLVCSLGNDGASGSTLALEPLDSDDDVVNSGSGYNSLTIIVIMVAGISIMCIVTLATYHRYKKK